MPVFSSPLRLEKVTKSSNYPFSKFVSMVSHLDENVISTASGSIFRIWEVGGISFQTTGLSEIQKSMDDIGALIAANAKQGRVFHSWMVREKANPKVRTDGFETKFAAALAASYQTQLDKNQLYANRWFFAVEDKIEMPGGSGFSALFSKLDTALVSIARQKALDGINELATQIETTLTRYNISSLCLYEQGSTVFSMALEFINFLVSGAWRRVAIGNTELRNLVGIGRLFSNEDTQESQVNGSSIYSTQMGVKEYSGGRSYPGLLNSFLEIPFECVVAQSWACVRDEDAIAQLTRARNRLRSTNDSADILIQQYDSALQSVTARELAYGHHSLQIKVIAQTQSQLESNNATAISAGQLAGLALERENPTSLAAHFSMIPGNLRFRPRPAMLSHLNFCAMTAFHNFPIGKETGNRWGKALFPVATTVNTVHYFNLHSDAVGNFFLTGKTRQGKTVLLGFLLAFTEPVGTRWLVIDRKRGLELVIRALGGSYSRLTPDENTGINPFDRPKDEKTRSFLVHLLTYCAEVTGPLTLAQKSIIDTAAQQTMELPLEVRGIDACHQLLPDSNDENGVFQRLKPWTTGGEYGWVFKPRGPGIDYYSKRIFGVDLTETVRKDIEKQAIAFELFDRYRAMLEVSGPKGFIGDEWQQLLTSPFWAKEIDDLERLSSSYNGIIGGASQEGEDLGGGAMRTVITQAASKIFLPMSDMQQATFTESLGCTQRQFEVIRAMPIGSRQFTLLQEDMGIVCRFNLKGLPEMPIFSTSPELLDLADKLMKSNDYDPNRWVPAFLAQVPN
jgi:type IV secretion system protein VirB4